VRGVLLLGCALTLLVVGCAPPAALVKERTLNAGEVMERVRERNARISTLKGNGSITIESPEGSMSGSFDVSLKKPDSMLVELSGPFGIHVGTLMLSRHRFLFYNRLENRAVAGVPDGRTLGAMFRLRMEFDEILRAFSGEFAPPDGPIASSSVQDNLYVVNYQAGAETKEFRVDGDDYFVASYRLLDSAGRPTVTALASDAEQRDGIAMPAFLRVIFPKERRAVTIAYDAVRFNEPVSCALALPRQVEVLDR
jgi:outer membrane lipoprotein-sorting protein